MKTYKIMPTNISYVGLAIVAANSEEEAIKTFQLCFVDGDIYEIIQGRCTEFIGLNYNTKLPQVLVDCIM